MKEKIIKGKELHPDMVVRRVVRGTPSSIEINAGDSVYFSNSIYFDEEFLVVREPKDELQQAIQDAIVKDRKQTIESLERLKFVYSDDEDGASVIKGITAAQDFMRALNEREG